MPSWLLFKCTRGVVLLHPTGACRMLASLASLQNTDWAVTGETVNKLCEQGKLTEAVEALGVLVQRGKCVSSSLIYTVLKGCVVQQHLVLGRLVHAFTVRKGYQSDTFLCNQIMRMYAAHGRLREAMDVFTVVAKPDAFMWSSIISAHVKHGQDGLAVQLYHRMRKSSVKPDEHVFVAALQACAKGADLKSGQQVHADLLASGRQPQLFVFNSLVNMYARCGMGQEALRLYWALREEGMPAPDSVTFVCLLHACATLGTQALEVGRELHAQLTECELRADVFVGSSLVNMYAKCGSLEHAQKVFDELGHKNIVTWTTLIAGYSQQGRGREALTLYTAMQEDGMTAPDSVTFVCLLQACATVGTPALEEGRQLHAQIREQGHEGDAFVSSSLVNMYSKCGSLEDAQRVFDGIGEKNVVTWNAMIAGYAQQGMGQEALRLYMSMQEARAAPDASTFVSLLQACASAAALDLGRQLHAQIKELGLQADVPVASSLINMYGKSGSMVDAQQVFDALPERDVVTWSALIAGYTCQGDSDAVFDLVQRMREDGIQPKGITFLSVLTVCSHVGLVAKGREYFEAMRRQYGISPTVEHYSCMVDLLGRAGQLDESLALVRAMPVQPDAALWLTLLGACRKWGNVEMGRHAFNEAVKLDKKDSAAYVLLSNIYTDAQMWEHAQEMQASRKGIGAWKQPGQSWWTDMNGLMHTFLAGHVSHRESGGRYARLRQIHSKIKKARCCEPQLNASPVDQKALSCWHMLSIQTPTIH